ncbi:MAG: translation initiation factor IF-2 subunit gamma [Candidatus Diapherotrites archaeon]
MQAAPHKESKSAGHPSIQAEVNIGVIGHVDHGKTSLVEAMTGKWTDTHSEELRRGISIRLGYADVSIYKCEKCKGASAYGTKEKCAHCAGKGKLERRISFVDAPGHETLMATMLSGAALMDGAILVIAANEPCPQPSTAEHLMALSISGTKKIVVAQNKVDLVDREGAMKNYAQIKKFLAEFGYADAKIIPTAAHSQTNVDALLEAIETEITTPKRDLKKELRMYVVRSFDVNKPGTEIEKLKGGVFGGSIVQGSVKKGDGIEIKPGIEGKVLKTKVAELATSTGKLGEAIAGGLVAVGTSLDPNITRNDQMRGQVIGHVGKVPDAVKMLKVELTALKRLTGEGREIIKGDIVVVSVGTAMGVGSVTAKKGSEAEITLKNYVVCEKGQKLAVSKRESTGWRLAAYGTAK